MDNRTDDFVNAGIEAQEGDLSLAAQFVPCATGAAMPFVSGGTGAAITGVVRKSSRTL